MQIYFYNKYPVMILKPYHHLSTEYTNVDEWSQHSEDMLT
jgi:hypothetical protein